MKILNVFTVPSTAGFFDGQFRYLTDAGFKIDVVSAPAEMEGFCQRNNVNFFPLNIARKIDIKADIKAIKELIKLIKNNKYDTVVGHTPKGALLAMIAARLSGTKNRIYFRHGYIFTTAKGKKRTLFKLIEKVTSLCSNKVINVSKSVKDISENERLTLPHKNFVIGKGTCGGIDAINLFNPENVKNYEELKNSLGINKDDFVLGLCGRICKDKGIEELVNAFKLLKEKDPEQSYKLILIGKEDARQGFSEITKNEILNNLDIINVGPVKHSILPEYYSIMDLFVFPSYREGFPTVILETSAMEIPVLVSKSHGCIDSIIPSQTGEYMDSITPEAICDGIIKMKNNPNRKQLGRNGRQHVVKNYDHSVLWPLYKDFYQSLENKDSNKKSSHN